MFKTKFLYIVFFAAVFFSCTKIPPVPPVDGIVFKSAENFLTEKTFLKNIFLEPYFLESLHLFLLTDEDEVQPSIIIEFETSWAKSDALLVSKTYLVPKKHSLDERITTTLADCLDGNETLVTIAEIAPPYTALLVDGKSVADEDYPLVYHVSIRIRSNAETENDRLNEINEKIAALETVIREHSMPLVQSTPSVVWLSAAGDLLLGRGSGDILLREGVEGILGKTAHYFKKSDIGLVNLEGAISSRGQPLDKAYTFRFSPQTIAPLKAAGINGMLLANNHVFDYGETAFFDTLEHLENNAVATIGAGRNITEAAAPFIFTKDNFEVRIFGLASYPVERSGWDGASVSATDDRAGLLFANRAGINKLKEQFVKRDDVLNVVFFHGGHEWTWRPDARTRSLYIDLMQSGADLIIGTHPHTTQGFEWIEGKPFFWSLGNYVFAGMQNTDGGEEGLLIHLGYVGKTLLYFEPVPVKLSGPRSDTGTAQQLRHFYALSRELAQLP